MNWEDLRLFNAAARSNSLSMAARSLKLSQPQLSRRLRGLEDQLGARLFERTPKGLRATPAGKRLIPMVEAMRDAADAIERARPDFAYDTLSVVRIAVDEVRGRLLTDHLPQLVGALDGIEIDIVASHDHANHAMRETEIQLRSCLPDSDDLIARRLGSIAYGVFAGRGYANRTQASRNESRFEDCDWIGFSPNRLWYPEHNLWLEERLAKRPTLRVNTMTAALDAAANDLGLALLPVFMAATDERLVSLTGPIPALNSEENLIVHRDLMREPVIRRTIDALAEVFKRAKGQLLGTELVALAG